MTINSSVIHTHIDKMQKIVKSTGVEGGFVDGFLSVKGGHLQIQIHPEIFMPEIEKMISNSNKKTGKF